MSSNLTKISVESDIVRPEKRGIVLNAKISLRDFENILICLWNLHCISVYFNQQQIKHKNILKGKSPQTIGDRSKRVNNLVYKVSWAIEPSSPQVDVVLYEIATHSLPRARDFPDWCGRNEGLVTRVVYTLPHKQTRKIH